MKCFIGCSGFLYREWKGEFYPLGVPQKDWLSFYATQFDTLEINSSFYKFPEAKNLLKFYDRTSADFRFSLKAPRIITHYKQMQNCEQQLDDFYNAISQGLKEKLGCALFQFPPRFSYSEERLELLIQGLKPGYNNVVEFRNESWFEQTILETLGNYNIIVSGLSHPQLPAHEQLIKNTDKIYYRFHGIPTLFYSAYTQEDLVQKAKEIIGSDADEAWIYFNNTASMAALENARFLKLYLQTFERL